MINEILLLPYNTTKWVKKNIVDDVFREQRDSEISQLRGVFVCFVYSDIFQKLPVDIHNSDTIPNRTASGWKSYIH